MKGQIILPYSATVLGVDGRLAAGLHFTVPKNVAAVEAWEKELANGMARSAYLHPAVAGKALYIGFKTAFGDLAVAGYVEGKTLLCLLGPGNSRVDQSNPQLYQDVTDWLLQHGIVSATGLTHTNVRISPHYNYSLEEAKRLGEAFNNQGKEVSNQPMAATSQPQPHTCQFSFPGFGFDEWCTHNGCTSIRPFKRWKD